MAIGAHFKHRGFTPAKYDETISRLEAAGMGKPSGRLYHSALDANGEIEVFDIWESQEALEAFGPEGFVRFSPSSGSSFTRQQSCPFETSSRAELGSSSTQNDLPKIVGSGNTAGQPSSRETCNTTA